LHRMLKLPPAVWEMGYYAGGLVLQRLISLALLPISTYFLAPAQFGHLEVLLAFADVASLLFGLSLSATLSRFVGMVSSWEERRLVCAQILGVAGVVAILLGSVCLLYAGTIAELIPGSRSTTGEIQLIVVTLTVEGLLNTGLTWLRIRGEARAFIVLTLGRSVLYALLAIPLLASGFGVEALLAAGAIASVVEVLGLGFVVLPETGMTLRGIKWGELAIYSGPLLLSGIAGFALGSFDRWVLVDWVGPAAIGIYGIAVRVGVLTPALLQPFHMWWMPKRFIVLAEENGAKRSADIVATGLVITMLGAAAVTMGGPLLIELMTPAAYHGAIKYVGWLALIYAVQEAGSLVEVGCYLRRDGFALLFCLVVSGAIAIGLYFLLIPHYGIAGAIAATFVAQVVRTVLSYVISEVYVHIEYPFIRLAAVAVLLVVLTALAATTLAPLVLALCAPLVLLAGAAAASALGLVPRLSQLRGSF
jgi:O-antigen/teichoic acid export membrane protein